MPLPAPVTNATGEMLVCSFDCMFFVSLYGSTSHNPKAIARLELQTTVIFLRHFEDTSGTILRRRDSGSETKYNS
ncbi:hypothetical protein GCM10027288_49620 [Bordetella tumbae]